MDTKYRYTGIQDYIKWFDIGENGCYLLSLCSIAEEVTGHPADLIGLMQYSRSVKSLFNNVQEIVAPCDILSFLTGKAWTLRIEDKVPDTVKENEYTILKYKHVYTHFRRRGFDTLNRSNTVANGYIQACYVFTIS